jgi:hypothetical protein
MTSRNKKIIIWSAAILALFIVIATGIWFWRKSKKNSTNTETASSSNTAQRQTMETVLTAPVLDTQVKESVETQTKTSAPIQTTTTQTAPLNLVKSTDLKTATIVDETAKSTGKLGTS